MSKYNATVYQTWKDSPGRGTFVASVQMMNDRLQMLRSNSIQCTGYEDKIATKDDDELGIRAGDAIYDWYIRYRNPDHIYEIAMDDCEGYKNRLRGLGLPPAYKA